MIIDWLSWTWFTCFQLCIFYLYWIMFIDFVNFEVILFLSPSLCLSSKMWIIFSFLKFENDSLVSKYTFFFLIKFLTTSEYSRSWIEWISDSWLVSSWNVDTIYLFPTNSLYFYAFWINILTTNEFCGTYFLFWIKGLTVNEYLLNEDPD